MDNKVIASRIHVANWIHAERTQYANAKFEDTTAQDAGIADSGLTDDGWYMGFIRNYIRRAQLFGIDTQQGRQALGKAIVTMTTALEASVRVHGPMPKPAVSSGEIEPWDRGQPLPG